MKLNQSIALAMTFILFACANPELTRSKRKNLDTVFMGGQLEKYFLSELAGWSLFSEIGQCKKTYPVKYLNFEALSKSYDMTYEELIQFQYSLNQKFYKYRVENDNKILLKDQAFYFYNVYDQIQGGGRDFYTPKFDKIHVYWIDPALNNTSIYFRFKKIINSDRSKQGFPVFISTCLTTAQVENYISKNKWQSLGAKSLGHSIFSPYDHNSYPTPYYSVHLSKLMPNKNIKLFIPKEFNDHAFRGKFKVVKY
jgi:hypothetical protein